VVYDLAVTVPLHSNLGGCGLVNTMFISHFQDMARGHFAIRRLERKYGIKAVHDAYRQFIGDEPSD